MGLAAREPRTAPLFHLSFHQLLTSDRVRLPSRGGPRPPLSRSSSPMTVDYTIDLPPSLDMAAVAKVRTQIREERPGRAWHPVERNRCSDGLAVSGRAGTELGRRGRVFGQVVGCLRKWVLITPAPTHKGFFWCCLSTSFNRARRQEPLSSFGETLSDALDLAGAEVVLAAWHVGKTGERSGFFCRSYFLRVFGHVFENG